MRFLRVHVGEVIVETVEEERRIEVADRVLREAFLQLGALLRRTPFDRWVNTEELVFDTLELEPLPLDELLGPRGAERLADDLYARLAGGDV